MLARKQTPASRESIIEPHSNNIGRIFSTIASLFTIGILLVRPYDSSEVATSSSSSMSLLAAARDVNQRAENIQTFIMDTSLMDGEWDKKDNSYTHDISSLPGSTRRKLGFGACGYSGSFYNEVLQNMCFRKVGATGAAFVSCIGIMDSGRATTCISTNSADLFDDGAACRNQPYCNYGGLRGVFRE